MPVVFLRRARIAEHYARSYGVGALDVGVIKAFDMPRQLAEAEVSLHALQGLFGALFGVEPLQLLERVDLGLPGIALRDIEQFGLVAALRHDECNPFEFGIGHNGHYHLLEFRGKALAYLLDGIAEHLGRFFVEPALICERIAAHHSSVAHMHIVDIHVVAPVVVDAEHIGLVDGLADDDAFGPVTLHHPVALLDGLSLLKAQFAGQAFHLAAQIVHQHTGLAPKDQTDMVDIFCVILRRNLTDAAALTAFEMVLQTQAPFASGEGFGSDGSAAGADRV